MGNAQVKCPSGFEKAPTRNTCIITCPDTFKTLQSNSGYKCVAMSDNQYSINLREVAQTAPATEFLDEQTHFFKSYIALTKKMNMSEHPLPDDRVKAHDGAAIAYAEAIETLKPLRPPTQPNVDIENAKLDIKHLESLNLRIIQICLFFVVIALLEYFLLPTSIVHGVAFLTLCVGFSLAIYLSSK